MTYRAPVEVRADEPELGEQRFCKACDEWWPLTTEFYRWVRGRVWQCKACQRAATRRWEETHREQVRQMWREQARRRAARLAA